MHMKCPVCKIDLAMSERSGVEIDYCPECRGVWLDRGELDKIIERSEVRSISTQQPKESNYSENSQSRDRRQTSDNSHHSDSGNSNYNNPKKKKESFLGDLFDF